ncbi:DUF6527 family protein [Sinorhizobium saheli]|uniref:DUF6527 family protein n=1 Tax=Sinorhizobium saheli TaxID=36856 RepID=UPI001296D1FB|nr:DUF6527 family protein [Sinorhizobium saheli]MQW85995.1 hypothetical protein [Sinorhizobium saheli]
MLQVNRVKRYWLVLSRGLLSLAVRAGVVSKPDFGLVTVDDNPEASAMAKDILYMVTSEQWPKWADFKCPCGCGDVISISIAQGRQSWNLTCDVLGRPTLHPSVWRKAACKSHFWLKHGKVIWC